jgi:hypothetical protein
VRTVRNELLKLFPSVRGRLEPDTELADALYYLLRTNNVGVTVDGWDFIRIVRESHESIEAVGLMWLLPNGLVPMAVHVEATAAGLAWAVQIGREDEDWRHQSESEKWKSVYLYASGDCNEPGWTWDEKRQGTVRRADA